MNNFEQKKFDAETLVEQLESASPLQASKILINTELYDQKDSIEVLEQIYEDFESKGGTASLTEPILLNICDEIIGIEKLGLKRKGITASRLYNDINYFNYGEESITKVDHRLAKEKLDANSLSNVDNKGKFNREHVEDKAALSQYKNEQYSNNRQIRSELEVNEQGQKRNLYKQNDPKNQQKRNKGIKTTNTSSNTDHNIPLKQVFDELSQSKAISVDDIKEVANKKTNYNEISEQLNKSKGSKSWTQYEKLVSAERKALLEKKAKGVITKKEELKLKQLPTKETLNNALKAEKKARKHLEGDANSIVKDKLFSDSNLKKEVLDGALVNGKDELSNKGLGELILLIIKPIGFEFKDVFENGLEYGTGKNTTFSAIRFRLTRAFNYVVKNIVTIGLGVIKDAILNFCKNIMNAIVDMFVGMLKKGLKIIVEGFDAIIQSFKVLMSDSSPAQKADAITKLLATTVVTYVGYAFEETILGFVKNIPMGDILSDAVMVMLTGIASTIVVWLIDKADFFSTKIERRTSRVKEVFELRIKQIKENTDAFETTAIEQIVKDRIKQRKLSEAINEAIENGKDVNQSIFDMADFIKIELKIKSTDEFLEMLKIQNSLEIA